MQTNYLSKNQKYLLGIFGGVGPLSHIAFENELLSECYQKGARRDQDYPAWILINATSTPDRTGSLLKNETPSLPHMIHFARLLENAGADFLFVICNTAHGYHKAVQGRIGIPWVHLMRIVAASIQQTLPQVKKIGILGTDATVQLRLYHEALEASHLTPVAPEVGSTTQQDIMNAIYHPDFGVKATGTNVSEKARNTLIAAAEWCRENGAEAVIAACTEVSVALTHEVYQALPIIDPLKVAARVALDIASGIRNPQEFMIRY